MSLKPCTVLLVEDSHNDILLLQRAHKMAKMNGQLQVVKDGEQAVAYLSGRNSYVDRDQHPLPTLILLDLKLPRKSGFEVLEWLRSQPVLKRLPVVVLTSSAQASDVNRAYELGANSYMVKPVRFDSLVNMLKALDLYWNTLNEKPDITHL